MKSFVEINMTCSDQPRLLELYNASVETKVADTLTYTNPLGVNRLISKTTLNGLAKSEPGRFDRLEQAGFNLIRYGDIIYQLYERFGGHYMDVGASEKIANGLVGYPILFPSHQDTL